MIEVTSNASMTEQAYPVNLLTFNSSKSFDEVVSAFEKQLGRFDQNQASLSSADFPKYVKRMEGSSGLMIMATLEMGVLPALVSSSTRARQYLVGNPLVASKMASHNTLAALYAPIRVLIYTREKNTCISYDQPSTTFEKLGSKDILQTAKDLDQKFETLARKSL
jgi:uncharacterized protein (DUF302 family)